MKTGREDTAVDRPNRYLGLRICALSFSHTGFELAKTDGNRLQRTISKPAKRIAVHNLRNTTP